MASEELIQFHIDADFASGDQVANALFEVPKGKRFLIDHITADVRIPPEQKAYIQVTCRPALQPPTGGQGAHHRFPLQPQEVNISTNKRFRNHLMAQVTALFCDEFLSISVVRGPAPDTPGTGTARVALSGRLVDRD